MRWLGALRNFFGSSGTGAPGTRSRGGGVTDRVATRLIRRFGARVDRFKLARKRHVRAALMEDEAIAAAVARHAAEHGITEKAAWALVARYVEEIVPFFNIIAYYRVAYALSRALLRLFYRVSVEFVSPSAAAPLPRDAIVIYLMNHRSNADYVLVLYALSGRVAISYAVGEWARAFPLEFLFKTFGAYFIRRRFREPLYHTVLERYVQLITRNGVTQGIFPEGGLTRDGRLQPGKIGLLDYILGIARDPAFRSRLHLVPVAVNYDRVLEDRSLLAELRRRDEEKRPGRLSQLSSVAHYLLWSAARWAGGRWRRYGRAAVTIGEAVPLGPWFQAEGGDALFSRERQGRLGRVQALCDEMLERVGQLIPVTPVPLVCAALQSFAGDHVERAALLERIASMEEVLREVNGRPARIEGGVEAIFERAYMLLRMRRVIARTGTGYLVLPSGRPLIQYYANSVAHLLGPFEEGIRARDWRDVDAFTMGGH